MTVLEVIAGYEAFHETTLSFMKKFAESRPYSEVVDDYQELVALTMGVLLSLSPNYSSYTDYGVRRMPDGQPPCSLRSQTMNEIPSLYHRRAMGSDSPL